MKESDKIYNECLEIINDLKNCLTENGWKGRFLGSCLHIENKLNKCKLRQFEARRKENRDTTVRFALP